MNRRSFLGFLAAAPVVPLMVRGDGETVFVETRVINGNIVPSMAEIAGHISPDTGRWSAKLAEPRPCENRQLAWKAIRAKMRGEVKTVEIETYTSDDGKVAFLRTRLVSDWTPA